MPQSDIQKAQKAMQDAGLSTQDAAEIARQKGATEQQIQDFENRIKDGSSPTDNEISDPVQDASEKVEEQQDVEKSKRESEFETNGRIFGTYLFNNKNLTFNPSINIQTPKNYEIGIGDQVIVNIWGNSQNNYQLQVNKNGQILIPDVGPVYIAGNTFQEAENKIIQRLTSIYADMGGSNPQTFAQVNMGQLRSIQVNLVGEVAAPGTYTLPVTATVFNGLYLSGGPNSIGSFRNIKIIRNNKVFNTIDIYKFLVNADPSENILLKDDDIIFIPAAEKRVEVNGEFKRNGLFELKEGEMLSDLIRFAGGFTENSYLSKTQIYRKTQQGFQISDIAFTQLATTPLINGDEIRNKQILSSFENRVTISGSVYRPGDYEWSPGLTLKHLILKADSIMPDAFLKRGIITRYNPDLTTTAISFNLEEVLTGSSNIALFPEDIILIKSHFQLKEQSYITVNGEVLAPGKFNWSDNLTLGDAIFLAGGFTEGADSTFIEVARRLTYEENAELTDKLVHTEVLNLSRDLSLNSNDAEFLLKPYDQVSVRQAPGFRQDKTVFISGEVAYAGAYAVSDKKQKISDLIQMAGGVTPQAFIAGATLQRFSNELGSEQVAIDLNLIINNPGSETDFFLNNGDRIYIPEYLPTVKITGSVQNPFSIAFESGKKAKYYIDRSGGFNFDAHKKKTYVRYANGTTAVTKSFILKNYPEVQPGSQIIVPQKPEKKATDSGKWIAWVSVLSSLALSAATIANITKK
ncbi:MAG: SLBB domain-containing protein [Draconibacterium sp.]|nr:SLBB domain-containing protein [Draconibacterium sp.]